MGRVGQNNKASENVRRRLAGRLRSELEYGKRYSVGS